MDLKEKHLADFLACQLEALPVLTVEAVGVLVAFATTYLCEGVLRLQFISTQNFEIFLTPNTTWKVFSTRSKTDLSN